MFHDQVLVFKAIFKFDVTHYFRLKYIRAPDHGTAKKLIGENKGDDTGLFKCISLFPN